MTPWVQGIMPSLFHRTRLKDGDHSYESKVSQLSLRFDGSEGEPACISEIQTTTLLSWGRLEFGRTISAAREYTTLSSTHFCPSTGVICTFAQHRITIASNGIPGQAQAGNDRVRTELLLLVRPRGSDTKESVISSDSKKCHSRQSTDENDR
jgi:hypothetical protein